MNSDFELMMKCDMCYDRTSEGLKPMCASVCPTGALAFGKYEDIVPLRRTKPVNVHVFGNQSVETRVYMMLPTDSDQVEVDGCGVFEGRLTAVDAENSSWIDSQVEESDSSNEF
jgi:Fe-S-cluster-containing dehydrogenase component